MALSPLAACLESDRLPCSHLCEHVNLREIMPTASVCMARECHGWLVSGSARRESDDLDGTSFLMKMLHGLSICHAQPLRPRCLHIRIPIQTRAITSPTGYKDRMPRSFVLSWKTNHNSHSFELKSVSVARGKTPKSGVAKFFLANHCHTASCVLSFIDDLSFLQFELPDRPAEETQRVIEHGDYADQGKNGFDLVRVWQWACGHSRK